MRNGQTIDREYAQLCERERKRAEEKRGKTVFVIDKFTHDVGITKLLVEMDDRIWTMRITRNNMMLMISVYGRVVLTTKFAITCFKA